MFCGKCGNELADEAKFCGKCGHDLMEKEISTFKDSTVSSNYSDLSFYKIFIIIMIAILFAAGIFFALKYGKKIETDQIKEKNSLVTQTASNNIVSKSIDKIDETGDNDWNMDDIHRKEDIKRIFYGTWIMRNEEYNTETEMVITDKQFMNHDYYITKITQGDYELSYRIYAQIKLDDLEYESVFFKVNLDSIYFVELWCKDDQGNYYNTEIRGEKYEI